MRSVATKSKRSLSRRYTSRTLPLACSLSSGKSVCRRTESRSSGVMVEFYRQKTWRILAFQKFLSTAYSRIVFRPTPVLTTKKLTVPAGGESSVWRGFSGKSFVEKLRTAEEIWAAGIQGALFKGVPAICAPRQRPAVFPPHPHARGRERYTVCRGQSVPEFPLPVLGGPLPDIASAVLSR